METEDRGEIVEEGAETESDEGADATVFAGDSRKTNEYFK